MTKISKCFAVFTAVASIAFLGFVSATTIGGPNWNAEIHSADLRDFTFVESSGEITTWSATERLSGNQVGKETSIAPEIIIAARKQLQSNQDQEIGDLDDSIEAIEADLKNAKELIAFDISAVEMRLKELTTELDEINRKIDEASKSGLQKALDAQLLQAEASERHEDVIRYTNQLAELRTDKFRAIEQQRILRNRLVSIRGANDRLERRNQQLKSR